MKYRTMGKNVKEEISALGFGAMRLPHRGEQKDIDYTAAEEMLNYAVDHGVNYVDTAWPYHGGESENFIGAALAKGLRNKVQLATKLPTWATDEYADFDKYLDQQLKKLQTDHIDFYLLHALNKNSWPKVQKLGAIEWALKKRKEGKIRYIGFSFHDDADVFKTIVDAWDDWDFTQIQYNYMDIERQAGTEGMKYAADKGIGIIVMEPVLGGNLVNPPEVVQALWDEANKEFGISPAWKPAEWAFQWLWNQQEVGTVLSGMSNLQQVKENVTSAARSDVGALPDGIEKIVAQVREKYDSLKPIPCTQCEYCMPCPNGVNIPRNFAIYNNGRMFNTMDAAARQYNNMDEEKRASACIACEECLEKCPQKIQIIDSLKEVESTLSKTG